MQPPNFFPSFYNPGTIVRGVRLRQKVAYNTGMLAALRRTLQKKLTATFSTLLRAEAGPRVFT